MKEKIAKLIDVKSIVTITLTFVVAYLTVIGQFEIRDIYLMIIAFYFGTQIYRNGVNYDKHIKRLTILNFS